MGYEDRQMNDCTRVINFQRPNKNLECEPETHYNVRHIANKHPLGENKIYVYICALCVRVILFICVQTD